jgi:tetratricopeptide (TPR) repeat protein
VWRAAVANREAIGLVTDITTWVLWGFTALFAAVRVCQSRKPAVGRQEAPVVAIKDAQAKGDQIAATGDVETGGIRFGPATTVSGGVFQAETMVIQQVGSATPSPHELGAPPADFTGREEELAELRRALAGGGVAISGVTGMGGVGKTALALKLADELKERYPDAQFYLDLLGTSDQPMTPAQAMTHVIQGFHPEAKLPESEVELRARYCSVLDGKRVLLLLDNAADARQVMPLIPPASCVLLVTSRQRFTLPGLYAKNLDVLPPGDARELLLKIEPRISEQADEIARLCGYLPLALRAAGSLLAATPDLDPADYARALRDERRRLEGIGTEGVDIGVEASFGLSYKGLPADAAAVFRRLAVFPGSFDTKAEEVVCEDAGHRRLSELVRRSLVQWDEKSKRYRLHDLVRLFAESRLAEDERTAARHRHAEHYEPVLRAANEFYKLGGDEVMRGLTLFDLEWENILAGQEWAAGHAAEDRAAARLCSDYPDAGAYVLALRLRARERITWLEAALDAARKLNNRQAEGIHLGNLGLAYADLGETRKAIGFYEQRLDIAREIGDRRGEGNALGNLGLAYAHLSETRKAIEFHQQALAISREIRDRRAEGQDLGNLGVAYADLGETRKAIEFYEQQLTITREIGDRRGEGNALGNLGLAYADLGETRKAIEFHQQALAISREIGDRRGEGNALGNLGVAYADLGETRKAIEFHQQALAISREIRDRRAEGQDLGNLGVAYAHLGETRKAIEFYEQRLDIAREVGDRRAEGTALWNMSLALDLLGDRAQAIANAESALAILERIEDPNVEKVRRQLAEWKGRE